MEKVILNATARENTGKSACKHIRKEGLIPGVVYKDGKEGIKVQMDSKELWRSLHTEAGENAIITMNITGGDKVAKKTVILQETQQDPINEKVLHVDFHEISLKDKIQVSVPVVVKGEAPGVTEEDGVLAQIAWELEVECLPTAIPEQIIVYVDKLGMNDAIHVKDLESMEGVTILDDPESVVVTVSPPAAEEEEEEAVEEGAEEGEGEPELIKKGKTEEEGAEEAAEEAGE